MLNSLHGYLVRRRARKIIKERSCEYRELKQAVEFHKKSRDGALQDWTALGSEEELQKDAYLRAERDGFMKSPEAYWAESKLHLERMSEGMYDLLQEYRKTLRTAKDRMWAWRLEHKTSWKC